MLLSLEISLKQPIQFTFVIPNRKKKKVLMESLKKTILKAHPNLDDLQGEGLILFNWSQVSHAQSSGDAAEAAAGDLLEL